MVGVVIFGFFLNISLIVFKFFTVGGGGLGGGIVKMFIVYQLG